jgi:hypothetical protein
MACWVKQQVRKEKGAKGEKEIAINPCPLDFNGEMWVGWGRFIAWAHKGAAGERSTQAILPLSLSPPLSHANPIRSDIPGKMSLAHAASDTLARAG